MTKEFDVAVVGATGAVGETMMAILEQRDFPVRNLYPLASERSAGKKSSLKVKTIRLKSSVPLIFPKYRSVCFQQVAVFQRYMPLKRLKPVVLWSIILLISAMTIIFP